MPHCLVAASLDASFLLLAGGVGAAMATVALAEEAAELLRPRPKPALLLPPRWDKLAEFIRLR
jgi:hypothetical protein